MIRFIRLGLCIHFLTAAAISWGQSSQQIIGTVTDENGVALPFLNVALFTSSDSLFVTGTITQSDGSFMLQQLNRGSYSIRFSFVGYEIRSLPVSLSDRIVDLGTIRMVPSPLELEQVTVEGIQTRVTMQADTTVYHAGAYKVNPDATAGDLMAKMPGIAVEDGKVQAQGEDVKRVTIDGQEYFGDDAMIALRNLPAEIISQIQVFDEQSDQSRFTGIMDASTYKIINIITKNPDARLSFGRIYAGYGTDNSYQAGGNANHFNGKRRFTLIGALNNINEQNFSSEDLLGTTAGSMQPGQGMGGRPSGVGGGSPFGQQENDFLVGSRDGINQTSSLGLNYIDNWRGKVNVNGSYFYNHVNNLTTTHTQRDYFVRESDTLGLLYLENHAEESSNHNHRMKLKIEYEINPYNSIHFKPELSFQSFNGTGTILSENLLSNDMALNETSTSSRDRSTGYLINGDLLYMHRFKKEGRTLSLNLKNNRSRSAKEEILQYTTYDLPADSISDQKDQETLTDYNSDTRSANLNYTEKLSERTTLLLYYSPSMVRTDNMKENYLLDPVGGEYTRFDSLLSNSLETRVLTHKGGATVQFGGNRATLNMGLAYQNNRLEGDYLFPTLDPIHRSFHSLLPTAMFMYKFSSATNIRMFLRTSNTLPSVSQLQEVVDNSNPMQLRVGNSDLSQDRNKMLLARFATTDQERGRSFFAFLMMQHMNDYIGTRVYFAREDSILVQGIELPPNTQLTSYENYDNYINIRTFLTYSMPVSFLKSNLNLNGGAGISQIPGETNEILNYARTTNLSLGMVLSSNISQDLDFSLSYSINRNWVTNSTLSYNNSDYSIHKASIDLNYIAGDRAVFYTESYLNIYQGLGDLSNNTPLIINASAGYKFLKGRDLQVSISVYDLLNQNLGISRNIESAYIEDVISNVLQRYFMLTMTYKFNTMI